MCDLPVGCCHLGSRVLTGASHPTTSLGGRLTHGPLYITLTYRPPDTRDPFTRQDTREA